jgi:hypothetical protein
MSNEYFLNRSNMLSFLDEIQQRAGDNAVSAYFPPGVSREEIKDIAGTAGVKSVPAEIIDEASASKTGAAIFAGDEYKCLIMPHLPLKERTVFDSCETEPLHAMLETDYKIGLVLVHLGSYAVGYCLGDSLVSSKVGTGLVHGRTRKGGSSSQRFQRRRQNQAAEFLDRVCLHASEHLEQRSRELDYIIYGGPRQTVLQLKKICPFLRSLEERELPLLEVPQLRQKVLEKTITRLWSSRIIEWIEG